MGAVQKNKSNSHLRRTWQVSLAKKRSWLLKETGWRAMVVELYIQQAMQEDQLKAFLEVLNADVALQKKISDAADEAGVVAIAKDAGLLMSFSSAIAMQQMPRDELSAKGLENATGGAIVINETCNTSTGLTLNG